MLLDTNIFLEILFKQDRQNDCVNLLDAVSSGILVEEVFMTNFSLGAIEASTRKGHQNFIREILMLIYDEKIRLAELDIRDHLMINAIRGDLDLDFDDAMQFIATQKYGTYIVTYDKHFQNKPIEVKTPAEVLKKVIKSER